jgi:glycosidase
MRLRFTALLALGCMSFTFDAMSEEVFRLRAPQDEIVYFLLPDRFANGAPANDRGGLKGDRLVTGFDPTSKAFYHGGDLAGLTARLDYIQSLGATAVWLAPIFKNKPVQGAPGQESAGYHGYWVTDFTQVDPHFGDEKQMQAFVDAAHARGMKVYLDIIANHTADVIAYRECPASSCEYRSKAEFPFSRRGGVSGAAINPGFEGDDGRHQTAENFAKLTRPDFAYLPFVPAGQEHIKVPEWLNDPIYYHNRGDTTFRGESLEQGDFFGLDDLMTESPRVVQGFIEIFGGWIDRYRIDGFRIDTARHVNAEFWRAFTPAMRDRAAARGIPNFHIFGEVSTTEVDVAALARFTRLTKMPAVLDFAFANAVRATVAGNTGTDLLERLFADDVIYEGGENTALRLPTFVSNHDIGRFAWFVRKDRPGVSDEEVLKRVRLAHAMLLLLRGVPVVYYGDEQGFVGAGGDQDARQDMFATRVETYQRDRRVGLSVAAAMSDSGAHDSFDSNHPLYRAIAELSQLRLHNGALTRGRQITRAAGEKPGLFAVSRIDSSTGRELIVAFNTSLAPVNGPIQVSTASLHFTSLHGECAPDAAAPGSYPVSIAPLDFVVCAARE